MIDNTHVYRCACKVKGLAHVFTAASTKPYIVLVDPGRAHLLRDVTWCVSRVHSKSKVLRARANASAPGIKIGRQLHQLAMRVIPAHEMMDSCCAAAVPWVLEA